MFNREFNSRNVIIIWDCLFAFDLIEDKEIVDDERLNKFNLNMIDFIAVAMLKFVRDDRNWNIKTVLKLDYSECMQKLFNYPSPETPNTIISLALEIKGIEVVTKKSFTKKFTRSSRRRQ